MRCPICGRPNQDDWPVTDSRGVVVHGGCQNCWEDQVDAAWWDMTQNNFRGVLEVTYEEAP